MSEHDPSQAEPATWSWAEDIRDASSELQQQAHNRDLREIAGQFFDAEPSLDGLISKLAEHIKEGRWSSVLIDDRTGRLPGLVIGGIMKQYAKEHDIPVPATMFMASGRIMTPDLAEKTQNLNEYVAKIKPHLGNRTLIFTEYMESGGSVTRMADALSNNGIEFDIAAAEVHGSSVSSKEEGDSTFEERMQRLRTNYPESDFYCGDVADRPDHYSFKLQKATGVARQRTGATTVKDPNPNRGLVEGARDITSAVRDKLYRKYFEDTTRRS